MSNVARKFAVDSLPYYIFLQHAMPTKTLRQLADCYTARRRPMNRQECLGKIHQEGLIHDIIDKVRDDERSDIHSRGRIVFLFPLKVRPEDLVDTIVNSVLPAGTPALRLEGDSGLEFIVDRGEFIVNQEVDRGAALLVYERGFIYSYRGVNLWVLPLTTRENPTIRLGGREWIPLLLVSGSLRSLNFGVAMRGILDLKTANVRFTSYQPAGIALIAANSDLNSIEARLYGPTTITRRVRTFTSAFTSILGYITSDNNIVATGYDVASTIGPNTLAKALYNQVKSRRGIAVVLRISGVKYRIIAYGGMISLDRRVSADEVAAQLLKYDSSDEMFDELAEKGTPQITFFSLKMPRGNVDLDLIVGSVPDEAKGPAVDNATYKYIGVNTINLSVYMYSSMSESRVREEVRSLLAEALREAAQARTQTMKEIAASEV